MDHCCCCSVAESSPTLCDPMDYSPLGFHYLLEFAQTHVHWISDAIQQSHPLLPLSSPAFNLSQHQSRIFSNEAALCIRWTKYWSLGSVLLYAESNDNPISFFLRNHHTTFHRSFTIFLLLPIMHKGFSFSTSSPTFILFFFPRVAILMKVKWYHCSFHLHFCSGKWFVVQSTMNLHPYYAFQLWC